MTNAEMLTQVNNAILSILQGGQSYAIGSRKLTRADLTQLYKMRQELESGLAADDAAAAAAANGLGFLDDCYVAVWPWER